MFTSAQQVIHLLRVAKELELESQVRDAFRRTVIASVGPTTSEMLRANGLPVDFEPSHPKLGHLVAESAANAKELLEPQINSRRRLGARRRPQSKRTTRTPSTSRDLTQHDNHPSQAGPFMRACRREPVPYTAIWLMRQASNT